MGKPSIPVGFDYARALLDIRRLRTYEEIASFIGYESVGSIANVLAGSIPPHPQGEAIWVLYETLFGTKPPVTAEQATGVSDFHLAECSAPASS